MTQGRLALLLGLALSGLALGGCGQLHVVGATDSCRDDASLHPRAVEACWEDQTTVLSGDRPLPDPTAGGRLTGAALSTTDRPLRHVIALDYSGSMYAGYDDPSPTTGGRCGWSDAGGGRSRNGPFYWELPEFADLVAGGPAAAVGAADPVHALVFNRDVTMLGPGGPTVLLSAGYPAATLQSPPAAWSGAREALGAVSSAGTGTLPSHPRDARFGSFRMWDESRLASALAGAAMVFESTEERDGILWVVTDNIVEETDVAGGVGVRDLENNRAFYQHLAQEARWQVAYAWPIHRAEWLCGSTLMIYGLYYSSRERIDAPQYAELCGGKLARLDRPDQRETLSRFASPDSPSPGRPFKLKPGDLEVVRLAFAGRVECPVAGPGEERVCQAQLVVENLLNHRQVDRARLRLTSGRLDPRGWGGDQSVRVRTAAPICSGAVEGTLEITEAIPPRGSRTVPIRLRVPAVETSTETLADHWESASFETFLMVGSMGVDIEELQTSIVIPASDLRDVYGVGALPQIFRNPTTDNLHTAICLAMVVNNPGHMASVVVLGAAGLLVMLLLLLSFLLRPAWRTVVADGVPRGQVRMTRLSWTQVQVEGRMVARARMDLRGAIRVRSAPGYTLTSSGAERWVYSRQDEDFDTTHKLEFRRSATAPTQRKRTDDDF